MRRFRGKGVLVMVAALLLLGDMLWTRGVPRLETDPPETPDASAVLYAVAETAKPRATVASGPRPTATAVHVTVHPDASIPKRYPTFTILPVATLRPLATSAAMPAIPPSSQPPTPRETLVALNEALRPVVTARVAALREPVPAARLDNALPPRPWAPPQGIAYIRWWMTA